MLKRRTSAAEALNPAPVPSPPISHRIQMHRPRDVATILAVSTSTLRAWRQNGKGPRFITCSRNVVRYPDEALRAWIGSGTGPIAGAGAHQG